MKSFGFFWFFLVSLGVHGMLFVIIGAIPSLGGQKANTPKIYTVRILETSSRPLLSSAAINNLDSNLSNAPSTPPELESDSNSSDLLRALDPLNDTSFEVSAAKKSNPSQKNKNNNDFKGVQGERIDLENHSENRKPSEAHQTRAIQQLRGRVRQLRLEVAATTTPTHQEQNLSKERKSNLVIQLRIFANSLRQQVKSNYSFPGSFDSKLRAVVRVVVKKDGSKRSAKLVQSSGNSRFDRLVCLDRVYQTPFPPIPPEITRDEIIVTFTCSP